LVGLVAGLLLPIVACGGDGDGGGTDGFTAVVPDGYRDFAEGQGELPAAWGDDNAGNTGGFAVLAPSADVTGLADLTVVELTGYEGYQGGLRQASAAGVDGTFDEVQVDGQEALGSTTQDVNELLAVRGDDVAVAARSTQLDQAGLTDLVLATDVPSGAPPTGAPEVVAPEGLRVLGQATSDLAVALNARGEEGYPGGPEASYMRVWEGRGGDDVLLAMTLPASAGDVDAVLGWSLTTLGQPGELERFAIDGRDAAWVGSVSRSILATTTDWGDLLVLVAAPSGADAQLPGRDVLAAVAESVEQT
jgi:hypothetical protein